MIRFVLSLTLLGTLFGAASVRAEGVAAQVAEDFVKYDTCLKHLQSRITQYEKWIPGNLFVLDRKLVRMTEGAGALQSNFELLKTKFANSPTDPPQRHLISNAVEGCHSYHKALEARASSFLWLFVSTASLGLTLTLYLILTNLWRGSAPPTAGRGTGDGGRNNEEREKRQDVPHNHQVRRISLPLRSAR